MFLRSVGKSKTQNVVSPPYIAHLFQDVSSFCENMKIKKIYIKNKRHGNRFHKCCVCLKATGHAWKSTFCCLCWPDLRLSNTVYSFTGQTGLWWTHGCLVNVPWWSTPRAQSRHTLDLNKCSVWRAHELFTLAFGRVIPAKASLFPSAVWKSFPSRETSTLELLKMAHEWHTDGLAAAGQI